MQRYRRLQAAVIHFSKNRIKISDNKCENPRFDDTYLDLVVCINVLDHVQNVYNCLKEMLRVTKQGDSLFLVRIFLTRKI